MKRKILLLILGLALLLSGCSKWTPSAVDKPLCRVVTGVSVTYENGTIHAQRQYTDADKMQAVLNYLRLIDPYGTPQEDPEQVDGSIFHITLSYSDGCQKTYLQKADRFMRVDGGKWQRINPELAAQLSEIVGQMTSDLMEFQKDETAGCPRLFYLVQKCTNDSCFYSFKSKFVREDQSSPSNSKWRQPSGAAPGSRTGSAAA